uniref:Uncharacterized protein n=1 Tax=Acrobeloides nanus TaxID=290746 RepID=A0A914CWH5_9BILA
MDLGRMNVSHRGECGHWTNGHTVCRKAKNVIRKAQDIESSALEKACLSGCRYPVRGKWTFSSVYKSSQVL